MALAYSNSNMPYSGQSNNSGTPDQGTAADTALQGINTGQGVQTVGSNILPGQLPPGLSQAGAGIVGTLTPGQLTSDQLNGLLNQNSTYLQLARQSGVNSANARGLLNSGMAGQNSQAAAIQAAEPIAQANSATISGLQNTNLNNLNQVKESQISAMGQVGAAGAAARGNVQAETIRAQEALQGQRENLAYQGEQSGLNRSFTQGMTQQEYQNQLGLNQQGSNLSFGNASALDYLQSGLLMNQAQQQFGFNQSQSEFNLGANLLQGQQQFYSQAGIQAMNNPAIMGDPQAFGGYMQFLMNPFSQTIDNLFSGMFGTGGNP